MWEHGYTFLGPAVVGLGEADQGFSELAKSTRIPPRMGEQFLPLLVALEPLQRHVHPSYLGVGDDVPAETEQS